MGARSPRPSSPASGIAQPRRSAYFLAQTLVGTGPIERDRLHAYAEKAMREAGDGTTWTAPDEAFEAAVHDGDRPRVRRSRAARRPGTSSTTLDHAGPAGPTPSGQKLVQLTMPGVPDVYQGTELWEDSLVDPDNRRPVDFAERRAAARRTRRRRRRSTRRGAAKLWVTRPGAAGSARRAGAVHAATGRWPPTAGRRPPDRLRPRRRHHPGHPAAGRPRRPRRLGSTPRIELGVPDLDVLTGRAHDGEVAVADVLTDLGVALLLAD